MMERVNDEDENINLMEDKLCENSDDEEEEKEE